MATIIGSAEVDIRAKDRKFTSDVRRMVRDIDPKDLQLKLDARINMRNFNRQLKSIRDKFKNPMIMNLDINDKLARDRAEDFISDHDGKVIKMNLELDREQAWRSIADVKDSAVAQGTIKLKAEIDVLNMHEQIRDFQEAYQENPIVIGTEVDSARLEQAIDEATDDADTDIDAEVKARLNQNDLDDVIAGLRARVNPRLFNGSGRNPLVRMLNDPEIRHGITGFLNATAGIIPLEAIKSSITGVAGNFEALSIQAAAVATAVGGISAALGTGLGFLTNVAVDLGQIVGTAAMLPSLLAGAGAGFFALSTAWAGFGDALGNNDFFAAQALAGMHPAARAAALALKEVLDVVKDATTVSYWSNMEKAIERTSKAVKGPLTEGMKETAETVAQNTVSIADSITQFASNGGMTRTFDNIIEGFQNAEHGTRKFSDAILLLTEVGSERLPRLGEWFSELGETFDRFIEKSAENGDLLRWIDTGVQRLQELGSIFVSTGDMIWALGEAANNAGISGLTEMASGFSRVAESMQSMQGQQALFDFFNASRIGFASMMDGFDAFADGVASRMGDFNQMMIISGDILQTFGEHLGSAIENTRFVDGLMDFFMGIRNGIEDMGPSIESFGNIFGDLGTMAGTLVENLIPGLNILTESIEGFVRNMRDGFVAVNPVLNEAVQLFTTALQPAIEGAGAILGGFLTVLSKLPAEVLLLSGAMSGLLLKGPLASTTKMGFAIAMEKSFTEAKQGGTNYQTHMAAVTKKTSSSFRGMKSAVGTAMKGIGGALKANLAVFAIAAAVGAITALVAHAVEKSGEFDKSVQAFADSWDAVNQKFDDDTRVDLIGDRIEEMAEWYKGDLKGALEDAGIAVDDFAERLAGLDKAELGDAADDLDLVKEKVDAINLSMSSSRPGERMEWTKELRESLIDMIPDSVLEKSEHTKETLMEMGSAKFGDVIGDMSTLVREMEEGAEQGETLKDVLTNLDGAIPDGLFHMAEAGPQRMRDALVAANETAGTLRENFAVLGDATTSADQKLGAFRSNLELLSNAPGLDPSGMISFYESSDRLSAAFDSMKQDIAGVGKSIEGVKLSGEQLFSDTGVFKIDNAAVRGVVTAVEAQAAGIEESFVSAYDRALKSGESTASATATAWEQVSGSGGALAMMKKTLQENGVEGANLDAVLSQLGLNEENFTAAIEVDGADAAIRQMVSVQLAGSAIESGNWTAYLSVQSDDFFTEIAKARGWGEELSREEIKAKLRAEMDEEEYQAFLTKLSLGVDPVTIDADAKEAKEEAARAKKEIENNPPKIPVESETSKFRDGINGVRLSEEDMPVDIEAYLDPSKFRDGITGVRLDEESVPVTMKTKADTSGAKNDLSTVENQRITNVVDIKGNDSNFQVAVGRVQADIQDVSNGAVVHIKGNDSNFQVAAGRVRAAMNSVKIGATAILKGNDSNFQVAVGRVKSGLAAAKGNAVSIFKGNDSNFQVAVGRVKDGLKTAKGTAVSIFKGNDSNFQVTIGRVKTGMSWAKASSATSIFKGNDSNFQATIARVRGSLGSLISSKTITIKGNDSNFQVMARRVRAGIASFRNRTVTVTTIARTVTQSAQGNIFGGTSGVQSFADGGFSKIAKSIEAHSFSKGSENHTAQIARGGYPYRVWAEPETGGEAYIPLAKSKRGRSARILEQVAQHFGMSLSRSFSSGGVLSGKKMGSVTSFANGGSSLRETRTSANNELKNIFLAFTRDLKGIFSKDWSPAVTSLTGMIGDLGDYISEFGGKVNTRGAVNARNELYAQRRLNDNGLWRGGVDRGLRRLSDTTFSDGTFSRTGRRLGITIKDLEYANEKLNQKLTEQTEIYDELQNKYEQVQDSVSSQIRDNFSLQGVMATSNQAGQPFSVGNAIKSGKDLVYRFKQLRWRLKKLRQMGVSGAIIQEISMLPLDDAIEVAEQFRSMSDSDMTELNQVYADLDEVAIGAGREVSESMYRTGIDAADGMINGLTARISEVEKASRILAETLTNAVKKALKIKSPSQLWRDEIGHQLGAGLALGITDSEGLVDKAAKNLVKKPTLNTVDDIAQQYAQTRAGNGPAGRVYNINNYYPQAEPTSKTIENANKDTQLIGY